MNWSNAFLELNCNIFLQVDFACFNVALCVSEWNQTTQQNFVLIEISLMQRMRQYKSFSHGSNEKRVRRPWATCTVCTLAKIQKQVFIFMWSAVHSTRRSYFLQSMVCSRNGSSAGSFRGNFYYQKYSKSADCRRNIHCRETVVY